MHNIILYNTDIETTQTIIKYCKDFSFSIDKIISINNREHLIKHFKNTNYYLLFIDPKNIQQVRKIRELEEYRNVSIILLIDVNDAAFALEVLQSINECFLFKPIQQDAFLSIAGKAFKRWETYTGLVKDVIQLQKEKELYQNIIERNFLLDLLSDSPIKKIRNHMQSLHVTFGRGVVFIVADYNEDWLHEIKRFESNLYFLKQGNYSVGLFLEQQNEDLDFSNIRRWIYDIFPKVYFGEVKKQLDQLHISFLEAMKEYQSHLKKNKVFKDISTLTLVELCAKYTVFTILLQKKDVFDISLNKSIAIICSLPHYQWKEAVLTFFKVVYNGFSDLLKQDVIVNFNDLIQRKEVTVQDIKEIINKVYDNFETLTATHTYFKLHLVLEYIYNNYRSENCNLQYISGQVYISKYYICELFKQYTNFTCSKLINICKLMYAIHLLMRTSENMEFIATEVNFNSVTYFNRVFKNEVGISPKKFRSLFYQS